MVQTPATPPVDQARPEVSVIIPARDEAASLGACLESIVAQQGIAFEVVVVDDQSTDATGEIARSFPGVRIIESAGLPEGWVGKNHAVWMGAQVAKGEWLLFTDADTVHLSGSLRRSVDEAKEFGADLLSYSPKQEVHGFWERALMPVIFAELTRTYRTVDVNDPKSRVAAANGQYLLIRRTVYDWVGGHQAIAGVLLEDVELAKRVKQSGRTIRFRYGGDAVRTRMYRSFAQMWEGWTKNLAVLFPHPVRLAIIRSIEFLLIALGVFCLCAGLLSGSRVLTAAGMFLLLTHARRFSSARTARSFRCGQYDALSFGTADFCSPSGALRRPIPVEKESRLEGKGVSGFSFSGTAESRLV